ncbi:MAG TPA: AraC family ligand binding domain-containing protein [Kiloniellales bacterium]|nr:AraC family ligand binding domain-containing protein [Kiloniellales bacterium]
MTSNSVFVDRCDHHQEMPEFWESIVIPKEDIDAEIERLASLDRPASGRRESLIVHPRSQGPGPGLAPGIQVTLSVLKPGESTEPIRHNSTQVNFCIQGGGYTAVDGKRIHFEQYDVWNHPSYVTYTHHNDTDALQVRLTYSNAALLEKLNVHIVEENPPRVAAVPDESEDKDDPRRKSPFGTFQLTEEGAWLMPYEILINPPTVESKALHWPWKEVQKHLDKLAALGKDYVGRRLYMLYNPMTGRTNGITPNFFATMTIRPPKIVDRPHRHVSAAINYYFHGRGRSTVEGKTVEWKAGDLMLSAPGWAIHNHASYDEPVYELTIQDQPLHIVMESLLWQESLKHPPAVLGVQEGFTTNRKAS